jgi:class 3 adenylate cyclase/DNA-binding SARP family transcriptional activator
MVRLGCLSGGELDVAPWGGGWFFVQMSASIWIGLLGTLVVRRGGEELRIAAPKQRAVLALLALAVGRAVSADELADGLWAGRPPETATTALQVYVSQLRKQLGADTIVTRAPGYALDLPAEAIDGEEFTRLAEDGRSLLGEGDAESAAAVLGEALSLWRGAAFAEFVYQDWAAAPARRLEELRLVAIEDRFDALLGLGQGSQLTGELEVLVGEYPLRERLRGQQMLALYRAGRQADALAAYHDARAALVDGLGIDPAPTLVDLERQILMQDPALGSAMAPIPAATGAQGLGDADRTTDRTIETRDAAVSPTSTVALPRRERKLVSILFCDLVGFTAAAEASDPEDVDAVLDRYYAMARRLAERHGGRVEKFVGDAVMAVFGAPAAREDDPERAVRAGLALLVGVSELREQDPSFDLEVRVGVTTGEAVVKLDAREGQGEAMVAGDVVNSAARLQAAAAVGSLLVDANTYQATRRAIRYERAAPVSAKGKRQSIPVWQAIQARSLVGDTEDVTTRLVGRRRELETLLTALSRSRDEESVQLVSLIGVPGIGKSRLVAELRGYVDDDAELVAWRQGRSLAYGEGVAFWALGEVVKAQAGITAADDSVEAERKLGEAVGALIDDVMEVGWVTRLLGSLVGVERDAGDGGGDRGETFAAWRRFVEAIADHDPTVIVFEDLHWADDGLLDFIDLLVEHAVPVPLLLVCTARPEFLQRRPGWAGGKPNATTLTLTPLQPSETAELISEFHAGNGFTSDAQHRVIRQAEGNPLFVREFVRMLDETSDAPGDGSLPVGVHGLIAARLDVLAPVEKRVAQVAAVLGHAWWMSAVASAGGFDADELTDAVHDLERRQLIRRQRRSSLPGETEFAFTHALIQEVAYSQIPRADRARYHELVADWIQTTAAQRDDTLELLAHHLSAAVDLHQKSGEAEPGLAARARQSLQDAGDRALALNAYRNAAAHYAAALDVPSTDELQTGRLLLGIGEARFYTSDAFPTQISAAAKRLMAVGDNQHAAEAEGLWAAWLVNHHHGAEAYEHARFAYSLLEAEPDSAEKAYVVGALGRIAALCGEPCRSYLVEFLRMAQAIGSRELEARALFILGEDELDCDDRQGVVKVEQSLAIARTLRSHHAVLAKMCVASDLLILGRIADAWEVTDEALNQAVDMGLSTYQRGLEGNLTELLFVAGDWDVLHARVATAPRTSDDLSTMGDERDVAIRAVLQQRTGNATEALRDARLAASLPEAKSVDVLIPLALGGTICAAVGEFDEAATFADRWIDFPRSARAATSYGWPLIAVVFMALGRAHELADAVDRVAIRTPWIDAADHILQGRSAEAATVLTQISAPGIAALTARGINRMASQKTRT